MKQMSTKYVYKVAAHIYIKHLYSVHEGVPSVAQLSIVREVVRSSGRSSA